MCSVVSYDKCVLWCQMISVLVVSDDKCVLWCQRISVFCVVR